jgi:hypothetical protein
VALQAESARLARPLGSNRCPLILTFPEKSLGKNDQHHRYSRDEGAHYRVRGRRRRAQLEQSVARYLAQLDTADRQEPSDELAAKTAHLKEKLVKLESEKMPASPDQQTSLTDPDSRLMATSGRGSGVVGYNVQVAVDTKHHLIVALR